MQNKTFHIGYIVKQFCRMLVWMLVLMGVSLLMGCGTETPEPLYLEDTEEGTVEYPAHLPDAPPPQMEPAPIVPEPMEEERDSPDTGVLEWTPEPEQENPSL